jgi:hypothetical protein
MDSDRTVGSDIAGLPHFSGCQVILANRDDSFMVSLAGHLQELYISTSIGFGQD